MLASLNHSCPDGHVCWMSNMLLPKRILMEMVPGTYRQGRPRKRWEDDIIAGSTFLEAYKNAEDRNIWADFVHGANVLWDTVQRKIDRAPKTPVFLLSAICHVLAKITFPFLLMKLVSFLRSFTFLLASGSFLELTRVDLKYAMSSLCCDVFRGKRPLLLSASSANASSSEFSLSSLMPSKIRPTCWSVLIALGH